MSTKHSWQKLEDNGLVYPVVLNNDNIILCGANSIDLYTISTDKYIKDWIKPKINIVSIKYRSVLRLMMSW